MASIALTTFALTLALFQMSSCKKADAETPKTYPIEGLWIGTYSADQIEYQGQGDLFYSFIIYPNGILLTKGKGGDGKDHYSTGTWTLTSSNIFSGTISTFFPGSGLPIIQSITATYSNSGTLTNGIWNDTVNPYGSPLSGKFSTMQRVN